MNGKELYINNFENKINAVVNRNPDLQGFSYFMTNVAPSTKLNYVSIIDKFLKTVGKQPENLTVNDFMYFMNINNKTVNGEQTTNAYKANVYHALKKYGKYLETVEILAKNPMKNLARPSTKESQKTIERRKTGVMDNEELTKFINTVTGGLGHFKKNRDIRWHYRDTALVLLLLNTGVRCSAVYKLDVSDIDINNHTITVTDKENKVRTLNLNDKTFYHLSMWINYRQNILEEFNKNNETALFLSIKKTRLSNRGITKIIEDYSEAALGKRMSPHKLRATFGTLLYEKTGDIYFVQQCMGHSNPSTTELYIRSKNDWSKKASDIMGDILS